ncbi:hypothetical protein [Rhizobium deserti]|uniref:hypothetical protein n=1 Tax=Rhizobium deserti TaxID=2547961 RepID=UPI001FDEF304|nr:hypothetical protein [Rhizobium deserti]
MTFLSNMTRSEGDPKVIRSGPSSLGTSDALARGLGWFSIGLGLAELIAPDRIANLLGMRGKENLIRAYGAREIGAGMLTLSVDKQAGLLSRVAGDGLDIATLAAALRPDNHKRDNVGVALAMVIGITVLDVIAYQATKVRHARPQAPARNYGDRSGFPGGINAARNVAQAAVKRLPDMRSTSAGAASGGGTGTAAAGTGATGTGTVASSRPSSH